MEEAKQLVAISEQFGATTSLSQTASSGSKRPSLDTLVCSIYLEDLVNVLCLRISSCTDRSGRINHVVPYI